MRVIVVEDNVLFCNYICNFLQKADLDTVRTYRLAQAKKVIGTSVREDDIVLADLRLPDGESTTLLQWSSPQQSETTGTWRISCTGVWTW